MKFVEPIKYEEGIRKMDRRLPIASDMRTKDWARVPVALREYSQFSAGVESARFLQTAQDFFVGFLDKSAVPAPSGGAMLKAGSRAQFVKELQDFAIQNGIGPLGPRPIQNLQYEGRLKLIFDTMTKRANDFGRYKQGLDPDILDAFPAQKFYRRRFVEEPRPYHAANDGVVRRKDDKTFWLAMNQDFGVPWGPWGYNSGMDVEDVDRAEAEALGLIGPDEFVRPEEVDFTADLQASVTGLDSGIVDRLRNSFGDDRLTLENGKLRWNAKAVRQRNNPTKPKPSQKPAITFGDSESRQKSGWAPKSPVSAALDVRTKMDHASIIRETIDIIDRVHDDGELPIISVTARAGENNNGAYRFMTNGKPVDIGIKNRGPWPGLTTAHEIGHFIDHQALFKPGRFASSNSPELEDFRRAAFNSQAIAEIQQLPHGYTRRYFLDLEEVWARAYAQFVALKSGDLRLLADLKNVRASQLPWRQWDVNDFAPIAAEIEKIFKAKGWM